MRRSVLLLSLLLVTFVCLFWFNNYQVSPLISPLIKSETQTSSPPLPSCDHRVEKEFKKWKNCILKNISTYKHDAKKLCEKLPFMANLSIQDFNNLDETKRHIPPLQNTSSIIVTLGIGHDTRAEEALIEVLPEGSKFYGADPMHEVNEDLYMKIGTYFPFAVGSKSKIYTASVLANGSYVDRNVVHIELVYFLSVLIGHKMYDNIWIDAEGAEYELFPYFYRGGELDRNGITVCQFNVEVHDPDDAKKEMFRKFIFRILRDNRYAFFRIVQVIVAQIDSVIVLSYVAPKGRGVGHGLFEPFGTVGFDFII